MNEAVGSPNLNLVKQYKRLVDCCWVDGGIIRTGFALPLFRDYQLQASNRYDPGLIPGTDCPPGELHIQKVIITYGQHLVGDFLSIPCRISRDYGIRLVENCPTVRLVSDMRLTELLMKTLQSNSLEFSGMCWKRIPLSTLNGINDQVMFECKIESSNMNLAYFPDTSNALYERNLKELMDRHQESLEGVATISVCMVKRLREWPPRWELKVGLRTFEVVPSGPQQFAELMLMSRSGQGMTELNVQ